MFWLEGILQLKIVFSLFISGQMLRLLGKLCFTPCFAWATSRGESEHLSEAPHSCYIDPQGDCWNTYTFSFFSSLQWPNLPRNELRLSCKKWMRTPKWKTLLYRDCLNKGSAHFYLIFYLESNIILWISNCALFRFLDEKIEGYNSNELMHH